MRKNNLPYAIVLGMTATGLSVARSLGRKGVRVYGVDSTLWQPGIFSRYVIPKVAPDPIRKEREFIEYLKKLGKKLSCPAILFFASDEHLSAVSRNRKDLQQYFIFNIPSEDMVENFLDKRRSHSIAQENGVLCPATFIVKDTQDLQDIKNKISFPCALKPAVSHLWRNSSFGNKKLIRVDSYDELVQKFEEINKVYQQIMVQEIIPGNDEQIYLFYSYFNSDNKPVAYSILRKLRQHPIHFGIGSFNISEFDEEIKNIGLDFLKKIKYHGMAGLELKRDALTGKIKFLELNMRFIMIGELAIASGIDLPYIMYKDILGEKMDKIPDFKEGVKLVNMELDIGSFWQYKKRGEITFNQYLNSFKDSKIAHTYLAIDDPMPGAFVILRLVKTIFRKVFLWVLDLFNKPINDFLSLKTWKNSYKKLPTTARHTIKWGCSLIPIKMRLPKKFFDELAFLEKSQWWSRQELENYQNEKICGLIRYAYDNIPYYNRLFKENKLMPFDIKTIADLPKIPVLTKETVRNNPDLFISRIYKKKNLTAVTTSGTTGHPLSIYFDPQKEFFMGGPFEWRFFRWAGYQIGDYSAVFRAFFLKQRFFGKDLLFQYNPMQKRLFFSVYDIEDSHIEQYAEGLSRYPIKVIQGYPSPLKKLIDVFIKNGIRLKCRPKAVLTLAEMVQQEQRSLIENYFNCKMFDWYAMEERAILACECSEHNGHHINPEFGICEFDKNSEGSNGCEIISTGLTNFVMPFIRYKTGDYALPIDRKCGCGRSFPLIKMLGGRNRCFVKDKKGQQRYVIGSLDKYVDFISRYQYMVKGDGEIDMMIIPTSAYNKAVESKIYGDLNKKFGTNFQIRIITVKDIKGTAGGKTPLVVYR